MEKKSLSNAILDANINYECIMCWENHFHSKDVSFCTNGKHPVCFECLQLYLISWIKLGIAKKKCIVNKDINASECECGGVHKDEDIFKVLNAEQKIIYENLLSN
jgi:hypothetical protein